MFFVFILLFTPSWWILQDCWIFC